MSNGFGAWVGPCRVPSRRSASGAKMLFCGTRCTSNRAVQSPRVPPPTRRPGKLERSCELAAAGSTAPSIRRFSNRFSKTEQPKTPARKDQLFITDALLSTQPLSLVTKASQNQPSQIISANRGRRAAPYHAQPFDNPFSGYCLGILLAAEWWPWPRSDLSRADQESAADGT